MTGPGEHLRRALDVPAALFGMARDVVTVVTRARNHAMPDFLTMYAQVQPDKPAVIDDRPSGEVST